MTKLHSQNYNSKSAQRRPYCALKDNKNVAHNQHFFQKKLLVDYIWYSCINVWSFGQGHLVIFDFGNVVIAHYIINIYIYFIVAEFDNVFSILTNDQMTK